MKKKLSFYLLALCLVTASLAETVTPKKTKVEQNQKTKKIISVDAATVPTLETSPFKDIAHECMKGFVEPERDEEGEVIKQKRLRTEIPQISDYDLFSHIFNILQTVDLPNSTVFNKNSWKDLEVLCGEHKEHLNLVYFLKRTQTKVGEAVLAYTLASPLSDPLALLKRQQLVKELSSNKTLYKKYRKALSEVAAAENNLFFFWETESSFNLKSISSYYFTSNLPGFKKLKAANSNPYVMELLCLKGRLFSYSLPLIIPALSFWTTKYIHHEITNSYARAKFFETQEFKKLEKDLKTVFSQAKPEEKKIFFDTLKKEAKGKIIPVAGVAGQVNMPELNGILKREQNDLQDSAGLMARVVLSTDPTEKAIALKAFNKSFGELPSIYTDLSTSWKKTSKHLTKKSRAFAARTVVNNYNPFEKELRNINSFENIPGIEVLTLSDVSSPEEAKARIDSFVEKFGLIDKYSAADKQKFFTLAKRYLKTPEGQKSPFKGILHQIEEMSSFSGESILTSSANIHYYGTGVLAALEALAMGVTYSRENYYNNLTNYLQMQMISVGTIIRAMHLFSEEIKHNKTVQEGLTHHKHLTSLFDTKSALVSEKLHTLVQLLMTNTFTKKPSYLSLKGRVFAAYALMKEIKNDLAPALLALGEIDAYVSSATLYNEYQGKPNGFCFAQYLQQDTPYIKMDGMWNPFLPSEKAVANSIELGGSKPLNVILTGPNAGGKSTFSKGLTLNVLLAQTIGMVPAAKLALTPFEKINTYMNITDDTAGGNSLFKSEVLRAQELLQTIANLDKKKFSFSIMDEMFSGTSPREGEAAGYAVAKNLGANTHSIAVIATHFPKLKELETTTGLFKNYQVRVAYKEDGSFSYPFKLEEGAADQNVAIAILQQQGFDTSILNDAQELLKTSPTETVAAAA